MHDPIQQLGLINHEKYSLKENDKLFLGEGSQLSALIHGDNDAVIDIASEYLKNQEKNRQ